MSNDQNMLNLRQQLRDLDLTEDMNRALAPTSSQAPYQPTGGTAAGESSSWLCGREEDKRNMVEQAIARLQGDREEDRAARARLAGGRAGLQQKPAVPRQAGRTPGRDDRSGQALSDRERDRDRYGYGDRDRERRRYQYGEKQPSYREREQEAARERRRREEEEDRKALAEAERDRKTEADRAASRRREEQRIAARNREEQRIRDEARQKEQAREAAQEEERRREEAVQKQRLDMMKAKQDAAARRDAQRERERSRQRDEIEQLKRDRGAGSPHGRACSPAGTAPQGQRGGEGGRVHLHLPAKAVAAAARDRPPFGGKEVDKADEDGNAMGKVLQRKRDQQLREERDRKGRLATSGGGQQSPPWTSNKSPEKSVQIARRVWSGGGPG